MVLRYGDSSPIRRSFSDTSMLLQYVDVSPTWKVCIEIENFERLEHKERKKHKQSNFILKVSVHFEGPAKIWETTAFVFSILYVHVEDNTEQYST